MSFGIPVRNGLGLGLLASTSLATVNGQVFSPASLFAAGEQGAWYDPSDFTTMFQNSVGTTPVTAVEQPVGLLLDKSQGLVLGSELVVNGDFTSSAGWSLGANTTISGGKANFAAALGYALFRQNVPGISTGGYYEITFTVSNYVSGSIRAYLGASPTFGTSVSANGTYTARFGPTSGSEIGFSSASAFTGSIDNFSVKALAGNHAFQATSASRPVLSARVNLLLGTATLATQNVTTVATSYKFTFSGAGTVTLSGTATGAYTAGTYTVTTTAGTLTLTVVGSVTSADLRVANDGVGLPVYQRVNTATDYDTTNFPLYLKFDGVDDVLNSTIPVPLTSRWTFVSGQARGANTGTYRAFSLYSNAAPNDYIQQFVQTAERIQHTSRALSVGYAVTSTLSASESYPYSKPTVFTQIMRPIPDNMEHRLNGASSGLSTVASVWDSGATFGTAILLDQSPTSAGDRIYERVIINRVLTATEITNTETWVNGKTKAY